MSQEGVYDFHTHSLLSDGVLTPIELIRRAMVRGYQAIAIADHTGVASLARIISEVSQECQLAHQHWGILAFPAVELTHLPPVAIPGAARQAKALGAQLVLVHGETPVEPVAPGTNRAALACPEVDILSHPGLITTEEAELAARNGVFLELSARHGHCLCNGHIARLALLSGAQLLVGSDAHAPDDLLDLKTVETVALGSGLNQEQYQLLIAGAQQLTKSLPL